MIGAYLAPVRDAATMSALVSQEIGEPVVVTPRHANALDDGVFASHATFTWRGATTSVVQPNGKVLRYKSYRPIASFTTDRFPCALRAGDRITRVWDGAIFEVTSLHRANGSLCCDLVQLDRRVH